MSAEAGRLGVIVNPIAGMGGRVGLKGTDGGAVLAEARTRGATPIAPPRAARALARLAASGVPAGIVTCPGEMGADIVAGCGLTCDLVGVAHPGETDADDTRDAAREMARRPVDLILFAGGDGTARDIFDAVGDRVPMLGIPTGVKMHSAVFATSPEGAGTVAAAYLSAAGPRMTLREAEVMDIDEVAVRENRVSAHLYGYARVPQERALIQNAKSGAMLADGPALDAACNEIVAAMQPGRTYVIGPGTTMQRLKRVIGFDGSLLGVDVVRDREPIGIDVGEADILRLLGDGPATIVVGVIGGQGYVLGRGNQPIGAAVVRRIGRDNIIVVSGAGKLAALSPPRLLVDTGERELDLALCGFWPVRTGPGHSMMMRVTAGGEA